MYGFLLKIPWNKTCLLSLPSIKKSYLRFSSQHLINTDKHEIVIAKTVWLRLLQLAFLPDSKLNLFFEISEALSVIKIV